MKEQLRRAVWQDIDLLFEWANDIQVRQNSFCTNPISYEEHTVWFKKILQDEHWVQYIYEYENEAIGQIRLHLIEKEAEISYSICKEKRGQGFGKKMLYQLKQQIAIDFPEVVKLTAYVKPENISSKKIFLNNGFVEKYSLYEFNM